MRTGALLLACLSSLTALGAQFPAPYLVRDLDPTSTLYNQRPGAILGRLGNAVFYESKEPQPGLWRSDGSLAGTYQIAATPLLGRATVWNGSLVYQSLTRRTLTFTDGTTPGTRSLATPYDVTFASAKCGTQLCLSDGNNSIWATDGVTAPRLVRFLGALPGGFPPAIYPIHLTSTGDRAWFTAWTQANGVELWVTDGTKDGTRLVTDLIVGPESGAPRELTVFDGKLQFSALAPRTSAGLPRRAMTTDGTAAGTIPLSNDVFDDFLFEGAGFRVIGTHLYFRPDGNEYARLDHDSGTTRRLDELLGFPDPASARIRQVAGCDDDTILFTLSRESSSTTEVWITDGTNSGTRFVRDAATVQLLGCLPWSREVMFTARESDSTDTFLAAGRHGTRVVFDADGEAQLYDFTATETRAFFNVSTVALGVTDGTPEGTRGVPDATAVGNTSDPDQLLVLDDVLYFIAGPDHDRQLHRSDGTRDGTVSIDPCSGCGEADDLRVHDGSLVFRRDNGDWISDGTPEGTRRLSQLLGAPDATWPFRIGDRLVFLAGQEGYFSLRALRGGTVTELKRFDRGSGIDWWSGDGRRVYFEIDRVIWSSDGTAAGTQAVLPGANLTAPAMSLGNRAILFVDRQNQHEVWVTDGTAGGTTLLVAGGHPFGIFGSYKWRELLFFVPGDGFLWRTDGTKEGTFALPIYAEFFQDLGDRLMVVVEDSSSIEAWTTDGSAAGTTLLRRIEYSGLAEIFVGPGGDLHAGNVNLRTGEPMTIEHDHVERIGEFHYAAGRLFYEGWTQPTGRELWAIATDVSHAAELPLLDIAYVGSTPLDDARRLAVFKVTMSGAPARPATVSFTTADITAIANRDYRPASGTLTLDHLHMQQWIAIPMESSAGGAFSVILGASEGAVVRSASATAVIPTRRRPVASR